MNLIQVFSTPIWESIYSNFTYERESILKCINSFYEKNSQSVEKYNGGDAYKSPMSFIKEEALSPLFNFICHMGHKAAFDLQLVDVDIYLTAAWVNIHNNRSCVQFDHVHQDTFSGVFYIQVPERSGMLVLNNPGINPLWQGAMLVDTKNKFNCDKLKITPAEGQIYIWPSYISHLVEPNQHDEERISISFNIIAVPKVDVEHTK